jgi:hypothetical protein
MENSYRNHCVLINVFDQKVSLFESPQRPRHLGGGTLISCEMNDGFISNAGYAMPMER